MCQNESDRPANGIERIEVTAAMVAAGVAVLDRYMESDGFLGRVILGEAVEECIKSALASCQT